MAQYAQESYNTFVQGLVTEAGELTFPANASIDELNCEPLRDGSRRRRLGISYEAGAQMSTETLSANEKVRTFLWQNVAEQAGVEFVVVQNGAKVWFYQQGAGALSAGRVNTTFVSGTPYSINLNSYARPSGTGASSAHIQVASIKGALVIASPEINTILVERNPTTGAFTVNEINFRVRDFKWLGDKSTYDTKLATASVSNNRKYDTKNSGWSDGPSGVGDAALTTYIGAKSAYPPLTHPWYSGKDASNNFSVSEFEKIYVGTSLVGNGHYIYDLYQKDRATESGISGIPVTTEDARFSTVASFAGRMFYSGMTDSTDDNGNKVYFSQLLAEGFDSIGELLQLNDPTSEELSDLLDTDGGFIVIPDAHQIKKLHVVGSSILVFAENGVWAINGVDGVFRATEYSVSLATEDGIVDEGSFVSAQGRPYWWSQNGIFTIGQGEMGGVQSQNLSVSTIQSFFNEITTEQKAGASGVYDAINRRVVWVYPDAGETVKLNNFIILDEVLQAFFPWRVSDSAANTNFIVDVIYTSGSGTVTQDYTVIDSLGNTVLDSLGNIVTVSRTGRSLSSSKAKFLVVDGTTDQFTFAEFSDLAFLDWGDADYISYAEAGFTFMGDLYTKKTVPYIVTYMKETATGFEVAGSGYNIVRDSSCKMSIYWDFKTEPATAPQEIFRRKNVPAVDTATLAFNATHDVIVSRVRPRGRGRVCRLRFDSITGKDFHLLGWAMITRLSGK